MSNQSENEMQQALTPEEVRQHLLTELETNQQAIAELSDEELEAVAGGFSFKAFARGVKTGIKVFRHIDDITDAIF
jgi:hypothetical protein